MSDYALQLREKQKLRRIYGILERQFRNYYAAAAQKKGATGENLLKALESRLDNVAYRMGFGVTRAECRQLVGHKAVMVNGRCVNIPSYQVKPGDIVSIRKRPGSKLGSKMHLQSPISWVFPIGFKSILEKWKVFIAMFPIAVSCRPIFRNSSSSSSTRGKPRDRHHWIRYHVATRPTGGVV